MAELSDRQKEIYEFAIEDGYTQDVVCIVENTLNLWAKAEL
jgi:hypothetical protein